MAVINTDEFQNLLKPQFHYANFHRNFPSGKVVDTNHESSDFYGGTAL